MGSWSGTKPNYFQSWRGSSVYETLVTRFRTPSLLFNAVQHSGGNRIHLSARSVGTQVLLEVSDNGTGMPPELNDSLFSPYVRGQGQTDYPGLGLGLTIVKEFVVLMQGTCGVEIETGRGSVFWVRLPAVLTANRVHEPDSRTPSGYEHQAG